MTANPIDPRRIFDAARGFSRAAEILVKQLRADTSEWKLTGKETVDILAPLAATSAFAVELLFKAILSVSSNSNARGHELKTLFGRLDQKHQDRIREFYAEDIETKPHVKRIQEINPSMKYEVDAVLTATNTAFEDWRYVYESPDRTLLYYGLEELREAAERLLIELKPEWAS